MPRTSWTQMYDGDVILRKGEVHVTQICCDCSLAHEWFKDPEGNIRLYSNRRRTAALRREEKKRKGTGVFKK